MRCGKTEQKVVKIGNVSQCIFCLFFFQFHYQDRSRPRSGHKISQMFCTILFQCEILQPGSSKKGTFTNKAKIAVFSTF